MAAVEGLSAPFAAALARGRAEYNARVAAAVREHPGLDEAALADAVRRLDPVVLAASAHDASAVDTVVSALFDATVELAARAMAGPGARRPEVLASWRALLQAVPRVLCVAPRRVAAASLNAIVRLAERGARMADWTRIMMAVAARTSDVDLWLAAGFVASWRCGLAFARARAFEECARLPAELASVALDLPAPVDDATMARLLGRLRADPWAWPPHVVSGQEPQPGVKFICRVGSFRGFGGRFLAPPVVGLADGVFVVSDGDRAFELHADFFGATLSPFGPAVDPPHARGALVLGEGGEVSVDEQRRTFPGLRDVSSWASTDATLAAALPYSHHVTVLARSGYGL